MISRLLSHRMWLALASTALVLMPGPAGAQLAQVIPPSGLAPGSQYQILFVTQGTREPLSPNIEDYNAFVAAEAARNPALPAGVTWRAVGWTSSVSAPVNAPSTGLPVYDTHGILLVPAGVGLYAGWMPSATILDQFGQQPLTTAYAWTGAYGPGYRLQDGGYLGDTRQVPPGSGQYVPGITMGVLGSGNNHSEPGFPTVWLDCIEQPPYSAPLYALSDPITVPLGLPQVSAGLHHTCAVRGDGTLACWGDNASGQSTPPTGVFRHVSAGGAHTCAVRGDGTLACWGDDSLGQATPPTGVFAQVSAGSGHTCAVRGDGTVACWGDDSSGQATPPAGTFTQVSAGGAYTCATQGQGGGTMVCWGDTAPLFLSGYEAWRFGQISAGGTYLCGTKVTGFSGSLACWGTTTVGYVYPPSPGGVWPDPYRYGLYAQVSASSGHACAVQNGDLGNPSFPSGSLVCWGDNTFGQASPPAGAFAQVSAGGTHSCAVRRDGTLTCWGANAYGQSTPPTAPGDFTGDLKSDVLWRHNTLGDVWLWPMNGAARTAETFVRTVAGTDWEIRGQGDQNGDGMADLLWRNRVTGQIYFWPMDGATPLDEIYVGTVSTDYDIVGTGDFDGDGKSDILWRHLTSGDLWIWLMDGATPLSQTYVVTVDLAYVVKGVADLDANGTADLVWHHATLGEVWVWLMAGATRTSQTYVGTVDDVGYQIVGVADHTGDRKADLLWHHATRGEVWIWPMNGATVLSQTYVDTVPETDYRIVGNGDYNGDGQADLLWHHATRGEVWVWLMNGTTKVSETWVATVPDTGYQIIKMR